MFTRRGWDHLNADLQAYCPHLTEVDRQSLLHCDGVAHERARRFTTEELADLHLLFAGHETTTNATSNMFQTLLADRALWRTVCEDPSVASNAVEESLRYCSSVIAWRRHSIDDFTIGDVTIPAGSNVLLLTSSANHDPAVFPEPERFNLARDNANRHLSFGFGAHLCLGAPLARLEMRVFLEEMTRRLPHAELVPGQEFDYPPNVSFRGPTTLFAR